VNFFNFAKMPKKPFLLRWGVTPHLNLQYANKMKKFDREERPHPKSRKSVFSVLERLAE
jgi:hypothetical protein